MTESKNPIAFVLAFLFVYLAFVASPSLASPSPVGTWEGTIVLIPGTFEVDFTLEIEKSSAGMTGFITVPVQQVGRTRLDEVEIDGRQVAFVYSDEKDTSRFLGLLEENGDVIHGTLRERDGEHPFELERVDERSRAREETELLGAGLLRTVFDRDIGSVRIIAVVAPDCLMCRVGSRLIQRYVLDEIADPRLKVYVLWEGLGEDDTEQAARETARLFDDPRVTHFWSEDLDPGARLLAPLDVEGARPIDVYLVYGAAASWGDGIPRPDQWFHNNGKMPRERGFQATALTRAVWDLLDRAPTDEGSMGEASP